MRQGKEYLHPEGCKKPLNKPTLFFFFIRSMKKKKKRVWAQ